MKDYQKMILALKQHGFTWTQIDEFRQAHTDNSRNAVRNLDAYKTIVNPNPHSQSSTKDTRKINSDGSVVEEIERHFNEPMEPKTPKEFMELHKYDPNEFEYVSGESTVWTVTNGDGEEYYNVRSKIKVKPLSNSLSEEQILAILTRDTKPIHIETIDVADNNLVIQLADLHFGVTTLDDTIDTLARLIDRIDYGYDTIVIEQLGDLFHSAQMKSSQTLKGTLLEDVDMEQAIEDAKQFYTQVIEKCLQSANHVHIEHANGNHSDFEYLFLMYLEAVYPQVKINKHTEPRSVYQLGKVGIMLSHGDTVKLDKLPMLFATEFKLMWCNSEHVECHTAHKHNKYTEQEIDGLTLRQAPTIKPNDLYEITHGWTTNRKIIQCIEYDVNGPVATYDI